MPSLLMAALNLAEAVVPDRSRVRSPNYPAISLPAAIERIKVIHEREQHLAAPREVMAKHLGYGGLNGSSLKILSALLKFGLMEKTKDDKRKITQIAVDILHPRTPTSRQAAIRTAALRPPLFAEIAAEWEGGSPSDDNLRSFLIRKNFAADAIPELIKDYRETMEFLAQEGSAEKLAAKETDTYAPGAGEDEIAPKREARMQQVHTGGGRGAERAPHHSAGKRQPYLVNIGPDGIEGEFSIRDRDSLKKLMRVLDAFEALLPDDVDQTDAEETETSPAN